MFPSSIQRRVDHFAFPFRPAISDSDVFFLKSLLLHQQAKFSRYGRGFCDQHKTARFAIEPINDRYLAAIRDFKSEEFAQLFPESRSVVRFGRMRQQKRRLIHDEIVVGFLDDFEIEDRHSLT